MKITIISLVAVLILVAGGYYAWNNYFSPVTEPQVIAKDQQIKNGQITIQRVDSLEKSLLVIHKSDKNGLIGETIGYKPINSGHNNNVQVTIEPKDATEYVAAIIHVDKGQIGTLENEDGPVIRNGNAVMGVIKLTN